MRARPGSYKSKLRNTWGQNPGMHGLAHALKHRQTNMRNKLSDMLGSREGSMVLHVADPQANNEISK